MCGEDKDGSQHKRAHSNTGVLFWKELGKELSQLSEQ